MVVLTSWLKYLTYLCIESYLFRDQVEEMKIEDKDKIVEILKSAPAALEADDIEDFCSLAQYYASKTPQSFRRVRLILHVIVL